MPKNLAIQFLNRLLFGKNIRYLIILRKESLFDRCLYSLCENIKSKKFIIEFPHRAYPYTWINMWNRDIFIDLLLGEKLIFHRIKHHHDIHIPYHKIYIRGFIYNSKTLVQYPKLIKLLIKDKNVSILTSDKNLIIL